MMTARSSGTFRPQRCAASSSRMPEIRCAPRSYPLPDCFSAGSAGIESFLSLILTPGMQYETGIGRKRQTGSVQKLLQIFRQETADLLRAAVPEDRQDGACPALQMPQDFQDGGIVPIEPQSYFAFSANSWGVPIAASGIRAFQRSSTRSCV